MTEPLEPLPPDVLELLAREKDGYARDPVLEAQVLSHVELAVGLAGPPLHPPSAGPGPALATAAAGARRLVGVAVAAFAMGGAVGGGAATLLAHRTVPEAARPTVDAGAALLPAASGDETPIPSGSSSSPLDEPPPRALPHSTAPPSAVTSAPSSASSRGALERERELLDVARAELARGRPDDALTTVEQHARRWPNGLLAEERDVVRIQALAAEGRTAEVSRWAAQFRRTYPKSMLLPAVDAAVGGSSHRPGN
jgi:hypothetical protein